MTQKVIQITQEAHEKLETMAKTCNTTVDQMATQLLTKKLQLLQKTNRNTILILEDREAETMRIQMPADMPDRCNPKDVKVEKYVKVPLESEDYEMIEGTAKKMRKKEKEDN